jgi:transcriptional regulator with XRE-family HTH domain
MTKKPVKNFLRKIREERNLTQDQLAKNAGITRCIISEFENGKHRPSPRTINKIAEALGCSYIFLMTGKEDSKAATKKTSNENRQKYLIEAAKLTKEHYGNLGFSEELLMKISGYLSLIIEDYEAASNTEKQHVIEENSELKAKSLASDIFLKAKSIT